MAPFKLFRITGSSSRSTSQENEPDQLPPTSNLVVTSNLNKLTTAITSSAHNNYLNIDESDQTSENSSLMSLNNDQRALLSAASTADQIGYSSPQQLLSDIPISPPPSYEVEGGKLLRCPSYETVMKENQLLALDKENNIQTTIHTNLLVESFYETPLGSNNNLYSSSNIMTSSPTRESLLIDNDDIQCSGGQCNRSSCNQLCCTMRMNEGGLNNNETCGGGDYSEERCSLDDENSSGENYNNCTADDYSNECQNQYHHQDHMDNEYSSQYYNDGGAMNYSEIPTQATPTAKGPEILYKSSKELYKAVAKECGITCKMTDTCRCVDCQSRYFDCEFDQNDNDTRQDHSDGGLGAGTPMFVNEVLHGTACTIL